MNLRSTTLCILIFIAALSISVLVLVSEQVVMGGYERLEYSQIQLSVKRVQNALERESERGMAQLRDWAWWGETLDFVTGKGPGYRESNLMDETFRNLQLSVMLFFDAQGRLIHGKRFDFAQGVSVPLSPEFLSLFTKDSPWVRFSEPRARRSGLVRMPDGILWLWSMPVLNDDGEGPAGGTLVMGRYLDSALVGSITQVTLLDWGFSPVDRLPGGDAEILRELDRGEDIVVRPQGQDRISGYALLRDADHDPVALLRVSSKRDIMRQGRMIRNVTMGFMLTAFLCVGLILYVLMDKGLLARIESLALQMKGIDGRHGLSRRVELRGRDEIARLAETTNFMLDALEQANAELVRSRQQLSLAFEAANEGLWDCDLVSRSMYLSPRSYRMLGYDPGEQATTVDACLALVHPQDSGQMRAAFEASVERSLQFNAEFRLRARDDSWVWIAARGRVVEWGDAGHAVRMVGTFQDIGKEKLAENALRESEERYRSLMQHSPSGMHIYKAQGDDLIIKGANPAAHSLFGTTEQEIMDRSLLDVFPALRGTRYPALYRQLAEGGEPSNFQYIRRINGVLSNVFSMTAFHFSQARVAVFFRDITQQYRAEEALRRSEEKFATLFRLSPDAILLQDMETEVIEDANAAFLYMVGRQRHEVLGRSLADLDVSWAPSMQEKMHEQIERHGHFENIEGEIEGPDASLGVFAVSGVVVDIDGRDYLVTISRDVTAIKKMQEVMVQSEKMFSIAGMAAGIAHEINNPLGIVLQASQNLQKRSGPDLPKNREVAEALGLDLDLMGEYFRARKLDMFIGDIQKAAVRASIIIRNMLNFSRHSESRHEPCDLGAVIEGAVALANSDFDLKKKYDFKRVTLDVVVEEGLPQVDCAATEIEQVVLNLLRNAAQAMAGAQPPIEAPRIGIHVSRQGPRVRVAVRDNGPGMSEELQRRVMEPFFTTKPPGVGTGLGLSVSYFIVTSGHGGTFTLSSRPGQGACFTIELPLSRV